MFFMREHSASIKDFVCWSVCWLVRPHIACVKIASPQESSHLVWVTLVLEEQEDHLIPRREGIAT
jgi:hypothetical protein